MLSKIIIACCVALATTASTLASSNDAQKAAADLLAKTKNVNHIALYFLSRTDNYSLSESELKHQADIRIYRNCGANCANLLNDVVSQLEHAIPVNCLDGQQDTLLELGDDSIIVYSYSGRMIHFDGKCFFNKQSISSVVENKHFIFQ